jgi:hypothetical protein
MTIGYRLSVIGYVCGGLLKGAAAGLDLGVDDVEIMCDTECIVKRRIGSGTQ